MTRVCVSDHPACRLAALLCIGVLLAASVSASAQTNIYQVRNPRTYRIDPPLTPARETNLIPQMIAFRPGTSTGTLIIGWLSADQQAAEVLEVQVDLDTAPPTSSTNDATLVSRVPALGLGAGLDYQSDDVVAIMSRSTSARDGVIGIGPLTIDDTGVITNISVPVRIPVVVTDTFGTNLGPESISFGGIRTIDTNTINTLFVLFAGDPAGVWVADMVARDYVDVAPNASSGITDISPIIPWDGETGTVNLDPDRHQLRAVEVVSNIAFLLTARRANVNDAGTIQYFLIEVDLTARKIVATIPLADVFDQRINEPSEMLGGDLDVYVRTNGTLRISIVTPGSGLNVGVLDAQLVASTEPPIYGGNTGGGGGGTDTGDHPVLYVCPGFGIVLPLSALALAVQASRAAARRRRTGSSAPANVAGAAPPCRD